MGDYLPQEVEIPTFNPKPDQSGFDRQGGGQGAPNPPPAPKKGKAPIRGLVNACPYNQ
jgi:hypothetical protein